MYAMKPFANIPAALKREKVVLTNALADALDMNRNTTLGRFISKAIRFQEPLIVCWKRVPMHKERGGSTDADNSVVSIPPQCARSLGLPKRVTLEAYHSRIHVLQKRSRDTFLGEKPANAHFKARFRANYESAIGSLLTALFTYAVAFPTPNETSSDSLTRYAIGGSMLFASSLFSINALFNKFVNIPKSRDFYGWLSGISNKGHYGK